jgi:predicted transcriptional regulator
VKSIAGEFFMARIKRFVLRMSDAEMDRLFLVADVMQRSQSDAIRQLIRQEAERQSKALAEKAKESHPSE